MVISIRRAKRLTNRNSSITQLPATQNGIKTYGIPLVYVNHKYNFYTDELYKPTVCKTKTGLRMYATKNVINKDGTVQDDSGHSSEYMNKYWDKALLKYLGVGLDGCRTMRLTSDIKGTTR